MSTLMEDDIKRWTEWQAARLKLVLNH